MEGVSVMQTKSMSFVESCTNIGIGYLIALCTQLIVLPWFNIYPCFSDNIKIASIVLGISIVRNYVIRRVFNRGS